MNETASTAADTPPRRTKTRSWASPGRLVRIAVAGVLMGTANLIPGVSGGTMILAMGLYQEFIDSVADLTRLRIRLRPIVFLGIVALFAAGAIFGLAGLILYLLFHYPTAMFSLFIGLTLGGTPLLIRALRPLRADAITAVVAGFALMAGVFLLKSGRGMPHHTAMDFVSGVVGSTTMVLPGISGSYMLLVMDQYERVVGAVDDLKEGLRQRDTDRLRSAAAIIAPVGAGALLGIVGLSNLLKFLLHRYRRPTLGVLLGILLGSVLGLWPFGKQPGEKALERRSVEELRAFAAAWRIPNVSTYPEPDKERLVREILANWTRRERAAYRPADVALAVALVIVGFAVTALLGRGQAESSTASPAPPNPNTGQEGT